MNQSIGKNNAIRTATNDFRDPMKCLIAYIFIRISDFVKIFLLSFINRDYIEILTINSIFLISF